LRAVLKEAPSFTTDRPPEFTREYERTLFDFWGIPSYWEEPAPRLQDQRAADLLETSAPWVRPDTPAAEVLAALSRSGNLAVPVVDADGRYLGLITWPQLVDRLGVDGWSFERRHNKRPQLRAEEQEVVEQVLT